MDEWGVDIAISGPQKGFMLPTGLAILCVSQKALGKGVYHINAVDCVTQWEIVATCERLFEAYLLLVIKAVLEGFPFTISGFYADNGSEYINHQVAGLLEKPPHRAHQASSAPFERQRPGGD